MAPLRDFARIAVLFSTASPAQSVAFDLSGADVIGAAALAGGETLAGEPLFPPGDTGPAEEEAPATVAPDATKGKVALLQGSWTPQQGLRDLGLMAMRPSDAMRAMDPNIASVVMSQVLDPLATVTAGEHDKSLREAGRTAKQLIQARKEEEQRQQAVKEAKEQDAEQEEQDEQEEQHRHHKHHHHHHHHHNQHQADSQDQQPAQDQPQSEEAQPQADPPQKKHHKKTNSDAKPSSELPAHKQTLIRIAPLLSPKSDAKFFKADYPNDERPVPVDHFSHPYPHVQDSDKYAKDYVKDENKDSGEWKAQSVYDTLKAKVAKERQEAKEALAKEQEERAKVEGKVGEEETAAKDARKAEEEEQEADKNAEEAEQDMNKIAAEKGSGKSDEPETVSEGTEKVEAAVKHLDGCKDKLDKARKQLDDLLAKADKGEQQHVQAKAEVVKAEAKAAAAQAEVEKVKTTVTEERQEHDTAMKEYEVEKEEAGKITKDLAKAEDRLKQLRNGEGPPPKAGRGAPGQPASFFHSGASASASAPLMAFAAAIAALVLA